MRVSILLASVVRPKRLDIGAFRTRSRFKTCSRLAPGFAQGVGGVPAPDHGYGGTSYIVESAEVIGRWVSI